MDDSEIDEESGEFTSDESSINNELMGSDSEWEPPKSMASQNIAIPEESKADHAPVKTVPEITGGDEAENGTVPEELKPSQPSPKAKKGKKNAKKAPEKKGKKKNVVTEEAIEDVDTNEAVSTKDPEGKFS